MPIVRLYRQWPGGPVIGVFEARHGPDNELLSRATLRVGTVDGLPALLDAGVKRMDDAYQQALRTGVPAPRPDPPAAARGDAEPGGHRHGDPVGRRTARHRRKRAGVDPV